MAGVDARDSAASPCDLGKYDLSFDSDEPERYQKDVPNAEVHVLEAGHFALDTKADEIAALV
jgi:hypothetical protein